MISDENLQQLKALVREVVTEVLTEQLEAHGLKPTAALQSAAAAERQRRYRERKRNADRNPKRNAVHREKRNALRNGERNADAVQVLQFLNEKTGKAYRPVDTNLEFIAARLDEGYTVAEMRKVIVRKCDKWKGDELMEQYLRPATLFNKTKFAQYSGELVVPT